MAGDFCHVSRLLDQLEYPGALDSVYLYLSECTGEVVSEFLEQHMGDRIRCDDRFQSRLGIRVSCTSRFVSFEVNTLGGFDVPTMPLGHGSPSVSFLTVFRGGVPQGAGEKLCTNLIAVTPREHVVYFRGELSMRSVRDLFATMPNIKDLHLIQSVVSDRFLQPDPPSHTKLLPSLRHLYLDYFALQNDEDWNPLITYLTHQTSDGQAVSLKLTRGGSTPIPPEVVRKMEGLVEELDLYYSDDEGGG